MREHVSSGASAESLDATMPTMPHPGLHAPGNLPLRLREALRLVQAEVLILHRINEIRETGSAKPLSVRVVPKSQS